jgi:hypothetical protein
MKNRVKYRLILDRACAAGVWQCAHITNMVASLDDFRRNPNKMIISLPRFALRLIGPKNGERDTTPPQQHRVNARPIVGDAPAHPGQRPGIFRLRPTPYAGTMIWSRKPKPAPKPRELERKVKAWGDRMAQSMEQSPEKTLQESQDVLKWTLRKNGPDSPFTIKAMNEVANQLSRQNRIGEETAVREQIVGALRKNVGAEDGATLNAEFKLATCLIALERPRDADPLLTHVVAGRSLALGEDDLQTLAAKAWSASVAKKMGRLPEARALQEEVVNGYESHGEGESEQGQLAVLNLASTLMELDHVDDAGHLVRSVLDVRRRTLGPDEPKTQEVQQIVASIEAGSE